MTSRLVDTISGLALLAVTALFYSQTVGAFPDAPLARNPVAVPRFLMALLALGGVLLVLRGVLAFRVARDVWSDPTPVARLDWAAILRVMAVVIAYMLGFAPLGFVPATAIFIPVACLVLGYRNPLVILLVTLIAITVIWYLFSGVFSIRPPGFGPDDLYRMMTGGT